MPMPVFLVDQDVSILEYNSAAARLLGNDKGKVINRRGGDVLNCLHAHETPKGCGHAAACAECVVRNSVRDAAHNRHVTRRAADMELLSDGKSIHVKIQVSCQPVKVGQQSLFLLILEGLGDK